MHMGEFNHAYIFKHIEAFRHFVILYRSVTVLNYNTTFLNVTCSHIYLTDPLS